eukprot:114602_1
MTETLTEEEKRLFSDPYAKHFIIGAWAIEWMGAPLIEKKYDDLVPGLYSAVVARTRFLDDLCRDAEKSGCKQLVILGAGYDTRCLRLGLSILTFKVDQPEVHKLKKARLEYDLNLTDEEKEGIALIPVDFNKKESIISKVGQHPKFQMGAKTVVLMEGVSQYIPIESTAATLKQISSVLVGEGSVLGITYVNEICYSDDPEKVKQDIGIEHTDLVKMLRLVEKVGEPWIAGWSSTSFKDFLKDFSFAVADDVSVSDLEVNYFQPLGITAKPFCNAERFVKAIKAK